MTDVLARYLDQPDALPDDAWRRIRDVLPDATLCRIAFIDLSEAFQFARRWLVLTETHLCLVGPTNERCQCVALGDIADIQQEEGLSTHRLVVVDAQHRPLMQAQFTRRQSRAVSDVRLLADGMRQRKLQGLRAVPEGGAHVAYREAVLKTLEEARATLNVNNRATLWRILGYLEPHKRAAGAGFALAAMVTALQLTPPYLTKVLVDNVLKPAERGSLDDPQRWVWVLIACLAMIWGGSEAMSFVRLRLLTSMGEKISRQLRMDIYSHLQKLSLAFFQTRSTGSIITRVSSDTERLWEFISFGLIDMVLAALQVIGVACALLLQDWELALLVLVPLPLMGLRFFYHGKKMQHLHLRIWRKWSVITGILSDVIPGMRVVKAFAREDREVLRFDAGNRALERESETLHHEWTKFWPTVVVLMHTCSLIVWVVGAPQVLRHVQTHGAQGLPLGVFIAFTGYMWTFWAPVQQLGLMSRNITRVITSASRVFEVIDTVPAITNAPDAVRRVPLAGAVHFDHVSFSYDGVRSVLKDINFSVRPGELIGLVGPSGGGKTTLINMICRFYDVTAGEVRIDGVPLTRLDLNSTRRQIGLVLQEPYLFHGTIAQNIAYGQEDASIDAIIDAARAANAHDFICGFPNAYETLVGERGQTLSGGERQRISIARAVLHDPRVLILDEATSSVDSETESKIQDALNKLVTGRTTFVIAHRLSTLSRADRLLVLSGGQLVEQGTHRELLARPDGVYQRLHQTQARLHAEIVV